jgi:diaminohydroxyphosphoribosylaminopyrimidine deaminase/5-amino-6-(5-phosphoribosylamino)uracil reductase
MTASFTEADHACMAEAVALAHVAMGSTAPNPAVGCVIARNGHIIARGTTQPGGRPHAEAMALAEAGAAAQGATVYVTLEPCAHHGLTPPCADALIAAGVARVVVAHAEDPDPRVHGRGIALLRAAGIAVETGLLAEEAAVIVAGFAKRVTRGLPWVTLKLAVSLDGCIALRSGESRWITGAATRAVVQRMRAEHDAVMVGIGTALMDDPTLRSTLDGFTDRPRWRVVVDSRLRLRPESRLVAQAREHALIVLTVVDPPPGPAAALTAQGVTILSCGRDEDGRIDLVSGMAALASLGLTSVLSEGGAAIGGALLRAGLVDRLAWHRAPMLLGDAGLPALHGLGIDRLADAFQLRMITREEQGTDVLETYEPIYAAPPVTA